MLKGKFITFEGLEGSGKTTQIKMLQNLLEKNGYNCVCTREPGGTKVGEILRDILKDRSLNGKLSVQTETLLLQTARAQNVYEVIKPALMKGKFVLCDRYSDSSTAYQGIGRGVKKNIIEYLNNFSTSGLIPDLTFLLDLSPAKGLKRAHDRENGEVKDRWEEQQIGFHEKIRRAFLTMAEENKNRYRVVSGSDEIKKIHSNIVSIIQSEYGIFK